MMSNNTCKEDFKAIEDRIESDKDLIEIIKELYVKCI